MLLKNLDISFNTSDFIYIIFSIVSILSTVTTFHICQGTVCHYQIRRHKDDALFSIEDDQLIHGLDALIEYYQKPPNGLATQLSAIVKCDLPPVDSRCQGRENLLHRATKKKSVRVVSELLQANTTINIDAKNQDGQAAVHLASLLDEHSDEILQRLIEKGANVNCRDKDGNTPLHVSLTCSLWQRLKVSLGLPLFNCACSMHAVDNRHP